MIRLFILLNFLTACASVTKSTSVAHELKSKNLSEMTILDLARSSYLKGCIDGKNYFGIAAVSGFDYCLEQAHKHEQEMKNIIEQEVK